MSELPQIKVGKKTYFFDEHLRELRNIKDPSDTMTFQELDDLYEALITVGNVDVDLLSYEGQTLWNMLPWLAKTISNR